MLVSGSVPFFYVRFFVRKSGRECDLRSWVSIKSQSIEGSYIFRANPQGFDQHILVVLFDVTDFVPFFVVMRLNSILIPVM